MNDNNSDLFYLISNFKILTYIIYYTKKKKKQVFFQKFFKNFLYLLSITYIEYI